MTWLSHIDIEGCRKLHNLETFVETGCYQGDGINFARFSGYNDIYSCDIGEHFVNQCRDLYPYAKIQNSDSITFLTELLPTLESKTLFWLDSHFPSLYGTDDTAEEKRLPLIDEIKLIKELKPSYIHDVIVCDDMRNFKSSDNPRYRQGELEPQFELEVDWYGFIALLSDTHNQYLMQEHDGVMIFTPKS